MIINEWNVVELVNKKVVFLVSSLNGGGAERVSAILCNDFHRRGIRVSVLETETHGNSYHIDKDIKVTALGCNGSSYIDVIKRLRRIHLFMKREEPDVIISLGYAFKYIDILRLDKRCNLVLSERNYPLVTYSDKAMKRRNLLFKKADKIVFQTNDAASCYGISVQQKAAIIPNPILRIDAKRLFPSKRIVTASRLVPQKNLNLLLEAFARFFETHPSYTLNIYGDGPLRSSLMSKAESLAISQVVHFRPFNNSLHNEIADAAMFVSSSDFEGLQNTLMEAMSMGIPAIATDCLGGGARLITDNGERALLVPRGDVKALAVAMGRIADECGLAECLSAKGKKLADIYSADAICNMWYKYITAGDICQD